MNETRSGIIRKKKTSYAQVSNFALRDENLSLKAKGLLALIESYLSLENFTLYKNFLIKKSSDGKTAFESAWQELKRNGYLIQYKLKDPDTKQFYYEYEISDNPHIENKGVAQKPDTDFLGVAFPDVANLDIGKATNGKPPQYIKTLPNKTLLNNILLNIQTNIDYFAVFVCSTDKEDVDNIIGIMADVLCMNTGTIKINGQDMPIEVVKGILNKIRMNHIQYVLNVIHSNHSIIKNMRNFVISTLYNSVLTLDLYYANLVHVNEN